MLETSRLQPLLAVIERLAAEAKVTRIDKGAKIEAHCLAGAPLHSILNLLPMSEPLKRSCLAQVRCSVLAILLGLLVIHAVDEQLVHDELVACVEVEHREDHQDDGPDRAKQTTHV